ncbi:MAG TPA: DUF58 domain-containing protein [Lentisphaeria bacterium]|nr:MAG: hypothetical protein A2X45_10445 [Lentisphaerae bacterium GWF2_50_93]HCE43521.1 DUF58 domain-containing protein [Lentisphaeria bacterium]
MSDKYHFLPPETLDALSNIEMVSRYLVEGSIMGLHRSPFKGFSSEFAEYRKYCPGDSVKYLDWFVYAKTDRYYVKQFENETNMNSYVVLDVSNSMAMPGTRKHKFNYACYMAAAFIYLMQRQRDAVGLFTYNDIIRSYHPPKNSRQNMLNLLSTLENISPKGKTDAAKCFHGIAEQISRRSLVVIFSDFFDLDKDFLKTLEHFRYKKAEVILFQILDETELQLPYKGLVEFEDMETGDIVEFESEFSRDIYMHDFNEYVQGLKSSCEKMNIMFESINIRTPFERALLAYFTKREELF